tara:strand:- start:3766 stop:4650 length:885 start_codon:yes stop_codon:yes gene_type:complete
MAYMQELKVGDEKTLERDRDLRVLSLGAGVQSSALVFKLLREEIEPVDIAMFADTGNEPKEVYEWLKYLKKIMKGRVEFEVVRNSMNTGHIINDYKAKEGRYALIPVYIKKSDGKMGFGRRTCTAEYKIRPIQEKVREILGVKNLRNKYVEMVMGISFDEIQRVKEPMTKWQVNCYPYIQEEITRQDIIDWTQKEGYPKPPRSACIICPYHNDVEWKRLKEHYPEEFAYAVEFDEWLRNPNSESAALTNFKKYDDGSEQYLYRSKIPLREATFAEPKDYQGSLFDDECEGMCGV